MNYFGVKAILIHELDRFKRTLLQSLASPIITTSLYFIVFGTAIGSRIKEIDGINYGFADPRRPNAGVSTQKTN